MACLRCRRRTLTAQSSHLELLTGEPHPCLVPARFKLTYCGIRRRCQGVSRDQVTRHGVDSAEEEPGGQAESYEVGLETL